MHLRKASRHLYINRCDELNIYSLCPHRQITKICRLFTTRQVTRLFLRFHPRSKSRPGFFSVVLVVVQDRAHKQSTIPGFPPDANPGRVGRISSDEVACMKALRTPDSCFENLPDFPFAPNYVEIDDSEGGTLRLHYIDEGPADAAPVLLMHGEPTWSFLYRKMIPILVKAGCRVIAPDLIGFGRSDKPTEKADYTYARHVAWTGAFVSSLDLKRITLVCQDWGGLIGLRLLAAWPERFDRAVAANTFLPTGKDGANDAFMKWRDYSQNVPVLEVGKLIDRTSTDSLSE